MSLEHYGMQIAQEQLSLLKYVINDTGKHRIMMRPVHFCLFNWPEKMRELCPRLRIPYYCRSQKSQFCILHHCALIRSAIQVQSSGEMFGMNILLIRDLQKFSYFLELCYSN